MNRLLSLFHHVEGHRRGQVLVLTALAMTVLIGMTALAIDVSAAYLTQRWERSIADAAALAGGQELQKPGTRALPDATDYQNARTSAMKIVSSQLGATSTPSTSSCWSSAGCAVPGTPYQVSIQAPSPTCIDCERERAIQVSIRQPSFGLTFGKIFGQNQWTVSSTSVAGIVHPRRYGVVVLRPPKPRANGSDANVKDIDLTGGSVVRVSNGDVGTNTNMNYSGGGPSPSRMELTAGYAVYHYGAVKDWPGDPRGVQVTTLIEDPNYPIPQRRAGVTLVHNTLAEAKGTDHATRCPLKKASVPPEYRNGGGAVVNTMPDDKVHCLRPGIYNFIPQNTNLDEVFLLEPGVYFLDRGLTNTRALIGGWEAGQPGVALVFMEANTQNGSVPGQLQANNSEVFALNYGGAYKGGTGAKALPARDDFNNPVETTSPNPTLKSLMTLMVVPDPGCYVAAEEPASCIASKNKTLSLPGGGELWVAGVQYAPTDNVVITGNSTSEGVVGQIIAWTLTFNSSRLNLEAAASETNGVLRLDRACSPTAICNP